MKQITNANQLTLEDRGSVVEVLQFRYYGTRNPEYVWQRGVLIEVATLPFERKGIRLVTEFDKDILAVDMLYATRETQSLPNTTKGECQGIQGPFRPENAKEYMDKLREIESERKATKEELERLLVA